MKFIIVSCLAIFGVAVSEVKGQAIPANLGYESNVDGYNGGYGSGYGRGYGSVGHGADGYGNNDGQHGANFGNIYFGSNRADADSSSVQYDNPYDSNVEVDQPRMFYSLNAVGPESTDLSGSFDFSEIVRRHFPSHGDAQMYGAKYGGAGPGQYGKPDYFPRNHAVLRSNTYPGPNLADGSRYAGNSDADSDSVQNENFGYNNHHDSNVEEDQPDMVYAVNGVGPETTDLPGSFDFSEIVRPHLPSQGDAQMYGEKYGGAGPGQYGKPDYFPRNHAVLRSNTYPGPNLADGSRYAGNSDADSDSVQNENFGYNNHHDSNVEEDQPDMVYAVNGVGSEPTDLSGSFDFSEIVRRHFPSHGDAQMYGAKYGGAGFGQYGNRDYFPRNYAVLRSNTYPGPNQADGSRYAGNSDADNDSVQNGGYGGGYDGGYAYSVGHGADGYGNNPGQHAANFGNIYFGPNRADAGSSSVQSESFGYDNPYDSNVEVDQPRMFYSLNAVGPESTGLPGSIDFSEIVRPHFPSHGDAQMYGATNGRGGYGKNPGQDGKHGNIYFEHMGDGPKIYRIAAHRSDK